MIADKHNADKSSFISVMFRPATHDCSFVNGARKVNVCYAAASFSFAHITLWFDFLNPALTNPRYALSRPATHGCSFVNGARKVNVCYAAASFSFAHIIS